MKIHCLFKYLGLFLWPIYLLGSSEKPYVSCTLRGQLGNQLFEIATTLAYAWDYDVRPLFPELNKLEYNTQYNRDHIFYMLDVSPLPRPVQQSFTESVYYSPEKIPYHPDQYLVGYFQSWMHFHHHRKRILQIFSPSKSVKHYLNKKYADLIAHPKTVSIHVRTFNPELHSLGFFPFLGLDYYQKAMDLFPEDTLFVVFSDRINWCKVHFSKFDKNIVFIEGNDHIQDLFLMSKLKHHIISNSTYGWWGAYLNTNRKKIVVAPPYWMHPKISKFPLEESDTIYFKDWMIVDADYDAPYPDDMRSYDSHSQSCDTQ